MKFKQMTEPISAIIVLNDDNDEALYLDGKFVAYVEYIGDLAALVDGKTITLDHWSVKNFPGDDWPFLLSDLERYPENPDEAIKT